MLLPFSDPKDYASDLTGYFPPWCSCAEEPVPRFCCVEQPQHFKNKNLVNMTMLWNSLNRSKLYTTFSIPGGSVTTPINIKVTRAAVAENGWKNSAAFKCQYNYHVKWNWQPCFQQRSRSQCLNIFNTVVIWSSCKYEFQKTITIKNIYV